MTWREWLAGEADRRDEAGLRRTLRPRGADEAVLDLAGNDYLGLSRHPSVVAAAVEAVQTCGAGSTGSRLVTGTLEIHGDLERALKPRYLRLEAKFNVRGGIYTNVVVEHRKKGWKPGTEIVSFQAADAVAPQ